MTPDQCPACLVLERLAAAAKGVSSCTKDASAALPMPSVDRVRKARRNNEAAGSGHLLIALTPPIRKEQSSIPCPRISPNNYEHTRSVPHRKPTNPANRAPHEGLNCTTWLRVASHAASQEDFPRPRSAGPLASMPQQTLNRGNPS